MLHTLSALPFPNIDPVALQIGPVSIHWYGIGYVVSILFVWWYAKRLAARPQLWPGNECKVKPIDLDDFVMWAAIGVVAGGRLGNVIFYDLSTYLANPLRIFAIWEGGMSFHGGFLGVVLAMILFARSRNIPVLSMFDIVAAGVPFGLGVVRIANFINSELWGRVSDVPWAVIFPNGGAEPRHPSQLYEATLEGLVLFALLWLLVRAGKLKAPGFIAGAFAAGYDMARITGEFFREPDAGFGFYFGDWLTYGMILSLPMVLIGLWLMARAKPRT